MKKLIILNIADEDLEYLKKQLSNLFKIIPLKNKLKIKEGF